MKKLYYTCPLKAAYMAKYHGIKIYTRRLDNGICPKRIREFDETPESMGNDLAKDDCSDKYYVHPDSIKEFEAKKDDVITVLFDDGGIAFDIVQSIIHNNDECYPYAGNGLAVVNLESMHPAWWYVDKVKTIQRNGNAFFMPEEE